MPHDRYGYEHSHLFEYIEYTYENICFYLTIARYANSFKYDFTGHINFFAFIYFPGSEAVSITPDRCCPRT